jgi:hypothetical protein
MVRAVDPKKVTNLQTVIAAYKRKAQNVRLNLQTGVFEVLNAKDAVVKTIPVAKGYDGVYVINKSEKDEDILSSGEFLAAQRQQSQIAAAEKETAFADIQDEMLKSVELWRSAEPGARAGLAVTIGRLQREMGQTEYGLRDAQYKHRQVLPVEARRKLYNPASNDDRIIQHPVYRLNQYSNLAKDRVVPIAF